MFPFGTLAFTRTHRRERKPCRKQVALTPQGRGPQVTPDVLRTRPLIFLAGSYREESRPVQMEVGQGGHERASGGMGLKGWEEGRAEGFGGSALERDPLLAP